MYGDPSLYKEAYEKSLVRSMLKAVKESQEEHTMSEDETKALRGVKNRPTVKAKRLYERQTIKNSTKVD
jgi:hypothetical protein